MFYRGLGHSDQNPLSSQQERKSNITMASSPTNGLLSIIPPDLGSEVKLEYRHEGEPYRLNMPMCGIGVAAQIRHAHEFTERIKDTGIPDDRSIVYFKLFRSSLTQGTRTGWDTLVDHIDPTIHNFHIALKAWINRIAEQTDRNDQLTYLRTVKKGVSQTCELFEANLAHCNKLTAWLPGQSPILTENELKNIFYNGMPQAWLSTFSASAQTVDGISYSALMSYMRGREKDANKKQYLNDKKTAAKSNTNFYHSSRGGRGGRGRQGSRRPYEGSDNNNERRVKPRTDLKAAPEGSETKDKHLCHLHSKVQNPHSWGKCFNHPANGFENRRKYNEAHPEESQGRGRG